MEAHHQYAHNYADACARVCAFVRLHSRQKAQEMSGDRPTTAMSSTPADQICPPFVASSCIIHPLLGGTSPLSGYIPRAYLLSEFTQHMKRICNGYLPVIIPFLHIQVNRLKAQVVW